MLWRILVAQPIKDLEPMLISTNCYRRIVKIKCQKINHVTSFEFKFNSAVFSSDSDLWCNGLKLLLHQKLKDPNLNKLPAKVISVLFYFEAGIKDVKNVQGVSSLYDISV